jgi:hypothetical protein
VKFTLTPNDLDTISRKQWDTDFKLIYTIMLSDSQLTCELEVHNPGNDGFECNTLLHSYLRVNVLPSTPWYLIEGCLYHRYRGSGKSSIHRQSSGQSLPVSPPSLIKGPPRELGNRLYYRSNRPCLQICATRNHGRGSQ